MGRMKELAGEDWAWSRRKALYAKITDCLRFHGPMTPDEIAKKVGETVLAIRPRCTELLNDGFLERTGNRRANESGVKAHVLKLTNKSTEPA